MRQVIHTIAVAALRGRTGTALAGLGLLLLSQHARADLLDNIKQRGEIVVATEARLAPFEFVENGKIVGYDPDLLALILQDLPGVKLKQLDLPWQGVLPGLEAKKFDYVVTAVTITKERLQHYALSLPVSLASVTLMKRAADTSINKPEDIVGKVIGSQTGSAPYQALEILNKEVTQKTGKGAASLKDYVDFNEAYADLANGRIDAVVQAIPNALFVMKQRPGIFAVVEPGFGPKKYFSWAGRKDADSAGLIAFFNDGIAKLNKNGKMEELQKKWFGYEMKVPADHVPEPEQ
jgi:polar amino acid transport system substrate-binding protein